MVKVKHIVGPKLVRAGDHIQLLLIQPPQPEVDDVQADRPRGEALAMLTAVLAPTGAHMCRVGERTAVVLVPELAFASSELAEVRRLLGGCGQKVVLVAGFGLAHQRDLQAWIEQGPAGTVEVVTPLVGDLSDPNARINGAWVLVNEPGAGSRGWAHVKTFPEQQFEKFHFESAPGTTVPLITLGAGLTLAPLICSELLQDDPAGQEPKKFAAKEIAGELRKSACKRVLVVTLSWQDKPDDERWIVGLNRMFHESAVRPRLRVATVNYAMDKDHDERRSLVGVFRDAAEVRPGPPGRFHRRVHAGRVSASLLRTSSPGVAVGPLEWGADAAQSGVDAWAVSSSWRWKDGVLQQRNPADAHAIEIGRAMALAVAGAGSAERGFLQGLADKAQHGPSPVSEAWLSTVRHGLGSEQGTIHADALALSTQPRCAVVQAAATTALLPLKCTQPEPIDLPIGREPRIVRRMVLPLSGRAKVALVWHSDTVTPREQYTRLVQIVGDLRSVESLVVIGGSTRPGKPTSTQLVPRARSCPATGPVDEGSLVHAGHDPLAVTQPGSGGVGWLSIADLAEAVDDAPDEASLVTAVKSLLDRAFSPDSQPGGSP